MIVNLEKKILVGVVAVTTIVAVGAAIIFAQKKSVEQAVEPPPVTKPEVESANPSEIAVGTKDAPTASKSGATQITWEQLYLLDYKTGKMPDSLKKLNKTKVRLPGFIVPLSDDLRALKEFLLVPNAQACIHVPPPPPNLIIYVMLNNAIPIEKVSNPSWFEGTLLIEKSESEYGSASYKMQVDKMEEYKF